MGIKAECINPRCEKEWNIFKVSKITGRQSICLMSDYQLKDKAYKGENNLFILQGRKS